MKVIFSLESLSLHRPRRAGVSLLWMSLSVAPHTLQYDPLCLKVTDGVSYVSMMDVRLRML